MKTTALITPHLIVSLQPREKEYTLHDARCDGLAIRVQPSGAMSWVTNKMRAQAGFHAHNTLGQILERRNQSHPLDLLAQHKLPVIIEANQVKNVFADINANRHQLIKISLRHATSPICSMGQA